MPNSKSLKEAVSLLYVYFFYLWYFSPSTLGTISIYFSPFLLQQTWKEAALIDTLLQKLSSLLGIQCTRAQVSEQLWQQRTLTLSVKKWTVLTLLSPSKYLFLHGVSLENYSCLQYTLLILSVRNQNPLRWKSLCLWSWHCQQSLNTARVTYLTGSAAKNASNTHNPCSRMAVGNTSESDVSPLQLIRNKDTSMWSGWWGAFLTLCSLP